MRCDPFYSPSAPGLLGLAHYMLKAVFASAARRCANVRPGRRISASCHVCLAATYAQLGRLEEAVQKPPRCCASIPSTRSTAAQARLALFKRPEDAEHLFDGLRKAGLPER